MVSVHVIMLLALSQCLGSTAQVVLDRIQVCFTIIFLSSGPKEDSYSLLGPFSSFFLYMISSNYISLYIICMYVFAFVSEKVWN